MPPKLSRAPRTKKLYIIRVNPNTALGGLGDATSVCGSRAASSGKVHCTWALATGSFLGGEEFAARGPLCALRSDYPAHASCTYFIECVAHT